MKAWAYSAQRYYFLQGEYVPGSSCRDLTFGFLTRIIHESSTAVADPGMSTALCSLGLLDVLFKYACGVLGCTPCIHARLHRLATNLHE